MTAAAQILPPLILALALAGPAKAGLTNDLAGHASPYLALHGQDPVHWQDLDAGVLDYAREHDRLILISSGYFACHWCHVMQRESFRDPRVARLLNAHYVPVKLDRELHPAVDAHLFDFVERTRGIAGWPLNVFLTPEGYPLVGLTYAPSGEFLALLRRLRDRWSAEPEQLARLARAAAQAPRPQGLAEGQALPDPAALRSRLLEALWDEADEFQGGFGEQSRFPMAPRLLTLLSLPQAREEGRLEEFLDLTLDQMTDLGLRDHLAGGFFRYTVDPGWRVPHFEKMLYTQALLARVFLRGAVVLGRPELRATARDTLDFALEQMEHERGGFVSSLSALDPGGEEGGAYLWSDSELGELLTPAQRSLAAARWGMRGPPDAGDGHLPIPAESVEAIAARQGRPAREVRADLQEIRSLLLETRAERPPPRDEKRLTAWNGLMLSALSEAARQLEEPRYREAAERLRDFLVAHLWDGEALARGWVDGHRLGAGTLEDYAYLAAGLRDWARLSGRERDLQLARRLVRDAWEVFHGPGGWRSSRDALLPGMGAVVAVPDGPLPSPSAVLIDLARELGDEALRTQAVRASRGASPAVLEAPLEYVSHLGLLLEASAGGGRALSGNGPGQAPLSVRGLTSHRGRGPAPLGGEPLRERQTSHPGSLDGAQRNPGTGEAAGAGPEDPYANRASAIPSFPGRRKSIRQPGWSPAESRNPRTGAGRRLLAVRDGGPGGRR